jgi:hypothetical protein
MLEENLTMRTKKVPITKKQYAQFFTTVEWNIDEVPQKNWGKIPRLVRQKDTLAIMASGTISDPKVLNGIHAIAGFDVLVHEPNPMVHKDEPEGNAYHYVIQKISDDRFPYLMYGPFKSETRVKHWFQADDLDSYWEDESS